MEIAETGEVLTGKASQFNDGEGLSRYDLPLSGRRGDRNFSVTIEGFTSLVGTIVDETNLDARRVLPGGKRSPETWHFYRQSCQPEPF